MWWQCDVTLSAHSFQTWRWQRGRQTEWEALILDGDAWRKNFSWGTMASVVQPEEALLEQAWSEETSLKWTVDTCCRSMSIKTGTEPGIVCWQLLLLLLWCGIVWPVVLFKPLTSSLYTCYMLRWPIRAVHQPANNCDSLILDSSKPGAAHFHQAECGGHWTHNLLGGRQTLTPPAVRVFQTFTWTYRPARSRVKVSDLRVFSSVPMLNSFILCWTSLLFFFFEVQSKNGDVPSACWWYLHQPSSSEKTPGGTDALRAGLRNRDWLLEESSSWKVLFQMKGEFVVRTSNTLTWVRLCSCWSLVSSHLTWTQDQTLVSDTHMTIRTTPAKSSYIDPSQNQVNPLLLGQGHPSLN